MVQEYQSPVRVYKYPFELVMAAYLRRFPTCHLIPVFVGSEILSDTTTPDGAETVTERRCKLNVEAPYLLKKMIGVDFVYFIQKNVLDRRKRVLNIEAWNESFSSRVHVLEKCHYFVHPENSEWTCFEQSAVLDVKSFFGFESTIEKLAMKQYSQNIAKGKEIIEHFISELRKDGITSMPPWCEVGSGDKEGESLGELSPSARDDVVTVFEYDETTIVTNITSPNHSSPCVSPTSKIVESELSKEYEETCIVVSRTCTGSPLNNHGHTSCLGLESDYIKRCLGNLTPLQESRLVQLRASVVHLCHDKVPSDAVLLRFLRARDFNVERALEMVSSSLVWRKKMNADAILKTYIEPKAVKEFFPGGWHHFDKEGRPLYLLRLGQMDVKGLIRAIGENGLLNLTLHICEEGLRLTEKVTRTLGRPVSTWALLVDLDGLNMRHLWRPGVRALLRIIEVVESNYPETLGRLLFVRAPRVFPIIWTVVGTFIHEATRAKFLIYGGNDYQAVGGLVDYIPEKYVPDFLGGPCHTKVPEGGSVPKCLQDESEEGRRGRIGSGTSEEDGMYTSVQLSDGEAHEIVVMSEESGTVLTWDFDVMHRDIVFSVKRHKKLPKDGESWESVVQSEEEFQQLCKEGESVQGSHVTRAEGKWEYVLCWKEACAGEKSNGKAAVSSGISDQASGIHIECPKSSDVVDGYKNDANAKENYSKVHIKYYVETLASADYRGSRSSLLSGLSQFSSLSNLAAAPSSSFRSTSSTSMSFSGGSICPSR
ncbi:SEC14-like protein 5 isoform X2 [Ischnura elegans]|uniref:SEC14-like protein 5 isoform X2 n=1 Tax=Ischnura elegans TaxID=197161 RepID=UPI001ED8728E|nr:SEC14-like protein 5 isoform X2 [Ischnura elegans]